MALEKATADKEALGTLEGVGRFYQQILIDTYSKVRAGQVDRRAVLRVLTDSSKEYCGAPWRISITRGPRPDILRRTESVNGSIMTILNNF